MRAIPCVLAGGALAVTGNMLAQAKFHAADALRPPAPVPTATADGNVKGGLLNADVINWLHTT
jgi:hypothetical protein